MLLDDLWYGNIQPQSQCTAERYKTGNGNRRNNTEIKNLLKLLDQNRKKLCATMTPEQKELFETYDDCALELQCVIERETFAYGFRLGSNLTAEALQKPLYKLD